MLKPSAPIRRRRTGVIDTDYYIDRAVSLRRQARCDLMRGAAGVAWAAGVATMLLLAILVLAPRGHVEPAPMDHSARALVPHGPAPGVVSPARNPLLTSTERTSRGFLSYGGGPNHQ